MEQINECKVGLNLNKVTKTKQLKNCKVLRKVVLYRDTVSVEPGSRPFFGPVSVSKDTFMDVDR